MNKKLITSIISTVSVTLLTLPLLASAITPIAEPNVLPGATVWSVLTAVMSLVWPIMAATAIVMFIIAAFLFLTSNGDPTKVAAARQSIIWAVVGLVVAIVSFSIPYIIRNTIGLAGF